MSATNPSHPTVKHGRGLWSESGTEVHLPPGHWVKENHLKVLDRSSLNPELSPTETFWFYLKPIWHEQHCPPEGAAGISCEQDAVDDLMWMNMMK